MQSRLVDAVMWFSSNGFHNIIVRLVGQPDVVTKTSSLVSITLVVRLLFVFDLLSIKS